MSLPVPETDIIAFFNQFEVVNRQPRNPTDLKFLYSIAATMVFASYNFYSIRPPRTLLPENIIPELKLSFDEYARSRKPNHWIRRLPMLRTYVQRLNNRKIQELAKENNVIVNGINGIGNNIKINMIKKASNGSNESNSRNIVNGVETAKNALLENFGYLYDLMKTKFNANKEYFNKYKSILASTCAALLTVGVHKIENMQKRKRGRNEYGNRNRFTNNTNMGNGNNGTLRSNKGAHKGSSSKNNGTSSNKNALGNGNKGTTSRTANTLGTGNNGTLSNGAPSNKGAHKGSSNNGAPSNNAPGNGNKGTTTTTANTGTGTNNPHKRQRRTAKTPKVVTSRTTRSNPAGNGKPALLLG
jgi:hypothetical protein